MGSSFRRVKNITWLIISLSSIFIISSCENQANQIVPSSDQMNISVGRGNSSSLVRLTHKKDFFRDQGLGVTIKQFQSGKSALQHVISGESDIAIATEFAFVSQSFIHNDLKIIAVTSTFKNKHMICKLDNGIKTPKDLRGKTIGITRKSGAEFFLGTFLNSHNISLTDVTIVDLKSKDIVENLVVGKIDAALTWEPYVFELKNLLEGNAISWPVQGEQNNYSLIISKNSWLQENQDKTERLLRAIWETEKFASSSPEAIEDFLLETFLYEKDYIDSLLSNMTFQLELPKELIATMTLEAQWRIDKGLTETDALPNYNEYIYFMGLEKVKKASLTIPNKSKE